MRRLRETDPIVSGVQGGALGGAGGFIVALLLLAPTYFVHSMELLGFLAVVGTQVAFTAGGVFGLFAGIARSLVCQFRPNNSSD